MASTFAVTRNHLIFGLCLPLAVLFGYLLAEPYASTSITVFVIFFAALVIPVLLRWYHPLLIFSWHLAMQPVYLPGRPQIWVVMSVVGLFFAILNRAVNPDFRLTNVPALTRPLIALAIVVVATALATGGIGLRVFGAKEVGGKSYVYLIAAIAGYFALSTRPIKSKYAGWVLAMFFLPGVSYTFGRLASTIGGGATYLLYLFPDGSGMAQTVADRMMDPAMERFIGMMPAAMCVFCWMLSRYGVTGLLDLARPWRLVVFISAILLGTFGGFRSMLILMALTFIGMMYLERIWHSRALLVLVVGGAICGLGMIAFVKKMPFPVQRALSFLPIEVDPMARLSGEYSTEWRLEMWKAVSAQIPEYLFVGKGYGMAGTDLYMLQESISRGYLENWEGSAVSGDFHSGPLSVIIPFGIWGVLAVGWLLYAGARYLYSVYRDSPETLKGINRFFLALFMARILFFLLFFGALNSEIYYFTGILGLSVALNSAREQEQNAAGYGTEFDDGPK